MAAELKIIAKLQDDASRGVRSLRGEVEGLGGSGAIAARGMQALQTAGVMAAAAVTAVAVAAAAFVASAIRAGINFESAFAGVVKTVDGVVDAGGDLTEFGHQLRDDFRQLALEIPVSLNELAKIGELGGQLGVAGDDLIEFTSLIAQLSVTTNLTAESAAMSFAQFANIMGSSQEDLTRFGSAVVWLGNNFATTEADIVAFATRIAGAGAIAGMTEADLAGIAAAFSSVGVEAEAGGTAVQKVLIDMNTAVTMGGSQLEKYAAAAGMTAAQFAAAWRRDPGQAFTAFVEGLGAAGDRAVLILDDLGLADARLVRGFLSVSQAGDLLRRAIEGSNDAFIENMALARESALRFQTVESGLELFKNVINDVKIALYDALRPALAAIIASLTTFVTSVAPQVRAFFEVIWIVVGQFVTALLNGESPLKAFLDVMTSLGEALGVPVDKLAAVRGLIDGLVTTVGNVLGPIAQTIASFVSWKDVLAALAIAIAGVVLPAIISIISAVAPIVAVFAGLVVVVAAVRTAFETNFLGIRDLAESLWGSLQGVFEGIRALLAGDTTAAMVAFRSAWETGWAAVAGFVQNAGAQIGQALGGLWQSIVTWFNGVDWAGLGRSLIEKFFGAMAALGQAKADLWSWIITGITNFISGVNWGQVGATLVDLLARGIIGVVGLLATAVAGLVTFIQEFVGGADWGTLGRGLIEAIGEGISEFAGGVAKSLGKWREAIFDWAGAEDWGGVGQIISEMVSEALGDAAAAIGEKLSAWREAIFDWAGAEDWEAVGLTIVNLVLEGLAEFVDNVGDAVSAWYAAVTRAIDGVDWYQVGYDIAFFVVDGLMDIYKYLSDLGEKWFGAISDATSGITWEEIAIAILLVIVGGLLKFVDYVSEVVGSWYGSIETAVNGLLGSFSSLGSNIVGGIISGVRSMAGALGDAIRGIISGALGAGQQAAETHSPSRLFARELGAPMSAGIALGIVQNAGAVINAINQVASETETAGLEAFGKAVKSIADLVKGGLSAVTALSAFDFGAAVQGWHLRDQIVIFRNIARTMVREFAEAALEFGTMGESVEAFADAAEGVIGLVEDGLAAVTALSAFDFGAAVQGWHLRDQIVIFRNIARTMVREFAEAALEFGAMGESVETFADAAGAVIGLVEDGLSAVTALSAFDFGAAVQGWHLRDQIAIFRNIARTMVREFAEAALEFGAMGESVESFADAAGAVIGLVEDGLSAVTALSGFDFGAAVQGWHLRDQIVIFRNIVRTMVREFADGAAEFGAMSESVQAFADAAEGVIGLVEPAIEAIGLLVDFAPVADLQAKASAFAAQLGIVLAAVTSAFAMASEEMKQALVEAAGFAGYVTDILDVVKPGIEALAALAAYTSAADLQAKVNRFTADLATATGELVMGLNATAAELGGPAVEAAKRFAADAATILDSVRSTLESLGAIANAPRVDIGPALVYLFDSAEQIRRTFSTAGDIGAALAYAVAFRQNLTQLAEEVGAAITQINLLVGMGPTGRVGEAMARVAAALENTDERFTGAGQMLAESFVVALATGIAAGADRVSNSLAMVIQTAIAVAVTAAMRATVVGEVLIAAIIQGIQSGQMQLVAALAAAVGMAVDAAAGGARKAAAVGDSLVASILSSVSSQYGALSSAGTSIGNSLVAGMAQSLASNRAGLINSVTATMSAAVGAARGTLGIASPSRVFAEMARQSVEGFARELQVNNGMAASMGRAVDAAVEAAGARMARPSVNGWNVPVSAGMSAGMSAGAPAGMAGGDVNVTINIDGGNHSLPDIRRQVEQAVSDALTQQGRRADAMRRMR